MVIIVRTGIVIDLCEPHLDMGTVEMIPLEGLLYLFVYATLTNTLVKTVNEIHTFVKVCYFLI